MNRSELLKNVWLVSFADSRMWRSRMRLKWQAWRFGFNHRQTLVIDQYGLDKGFVSKMSGRLIKGSRGYGYWSWKPQVILQALNKMDKGDILLYMDTGCYLNRNGLPRFAEWLNKMNKTDILAFQCRSLIGTPAFDPLHHFYPDKEWAKGDLIQYFGMYENDEILESGQMGGTVILTRKTDKSIKFFNEFLSVVVEHFDLIDDTPSVAPNKPGFIENRHDQSVFSLLCKKYGYDKHSLSCCEYAPCAYCAPSQFRGDESWAPSSFDNMKDEPILQVRARSVGWRSYVPNFFWKIYHQICLKAGRCK